MLTEIRIKDLALIDELTLSFHPGLNIITGETGAGKSMIVEAINLLIGAKADSSRIRRGCECAEVQGLFSWDDGEQTLRRQVGVNGRSRSYVDGRLATLRELAEHGDAQFETHGQHGHQALLLPKNQLEMIDRFGGPAAAEAKSDYREILRGRRDAVAELEQIKSLAAERADRLRFLEWRVQELEHARLVAGEDEELSERVARLRNAAALLEAISAARESLDNGVVDGVQIAVVQLERIIEKDESVAPVLDRLRSIAADLEEASGLAREYRESLVFEDGALEELQERLFALKDLMNKYELSIEGLIDQLSSDRDELRSLRDSGAQGEGLARRISELDVRLETAATRLTEIRTRAGKSFAKVVSGHLLDMAFNQVRFEVACETMTGEAGLVQDGRDRIEFLFSGNAGEPLRPLAAVASGGELARVMLAVRSVFGQGESALTLLFDEIDAGIGGKTAAKVGERLAWLSRTSQVICVTHLAPIAAFADHHLAIAKNEINSSTRVHARAVAGDERLLELSRLGGAVDESAVSVEHARQLVDQARSKKTM